MMTMERVSNEDMRRMAACAGNVFVTATQAVSMATELLLSRDVADEYRASLRARSINNHAMNALDAAFHKPAVSGPTPIELARTHGDAWRAAGGHEYGVESFITEAIESALAAERARIEGSGGKD